MNASPETTTGAEAEVVPTAPTIIPTEELLRLLPPVTSVWVPAQLRDLTATEDAALERFIRHLPVSSQLDSIGLLYLTRLVAPFFEGQDGIIVSPQQIVEAWDRHFTRHHNTTTVPIVATCLRLIFGSANVLVIGQLEIERDAATGTLTLRRNAENYNRLLEFLVLLDGEVLA